MINDPKILKTPQKQESTKLGLENPKTQAPMNIKDPKTPRKNIRAKLPNTLKT